MESAGSWGEWGREIGHVGGAEVGAPLGAIGGIEDGVEGRRKAESFSMVVIVVMVVEESHQAVPWSRDCLRRGQRKNMRGRGGTRMNERTNEGMKEEEQKVKREN